MEPISMTVASLAIANKLLGKTAEEISNDLASVYALGRDKILETATRKTDVSVEGRVNLRVARDVFWNGSYSDEAICAEYFGGILASARSEDGLDDTAIYYLDIIKSLSSAQLNLHYTLYNRTNKLLLKDASKNTINVGLDSEIHSIKVWFDTIELELLGMFPDIDLEALYRKGLIHEYRLLKHTNDEGYEKFVLFYTPTTLGVHLYTIVNNQFQEWRNFSTFDFSDFPGIALPEQFSFQKSDLLT